MICICIINYIFFYIYNMHICIICICIVKKMIVVSKIEYGMHYWFVVVTSVKYMYSVTTTNQLIYYLPRKVYNHIMYGILKVHTFSYVRTLFRLRLHHFHHCFTIVCCGHVSTAGSTFTALLRAVVSSSHCTLHCSHVLL